MKQQQIKSKINRYLIVLIMLVVSAGSVQADMLTLRSGRKVRGRILSEEENAITFKTRFGVEMTFDRSEVLEIKKEKLEVEVQRGLELQKALDKLYSKLTDSIARRDWEDAQSCLSAKMQKQWEEQMTQQGMSSEVLLSLMKNLGPLHATALEARRTRKGSALLLEGQFAQEIKKRGIVYFVIDDERWKVDSLDWTDTGMVDRVFSPETRGIQEEGVIRGVVVLPDVDAQGDLAVRFWPADLSADGAKKIYSVLIKKENILSFEVPFEIRDVPAGQYWGDALWEVGPEASASLVAFEMNVAVSGNYRGRTNESVEVSAGGEVEVRIVCSSSFAKDSLDGHSVEYQFIRLGYHGDPKSRDSKILLDVKNNSDKPLNVLRFQMEINDYRSLVSMVQAPSQVFKGEVTQFSLDSVFDTYWKQQPRGLSDRIHEVDVTVRSIDNEAVLSEHLSIWKRSGR